MFQNDHALDLSTAFVSFAGKTHDFEGNELRDKFLVLDSLQQRIDSITFQGVGKLGRLHLREEVEMCVEKLLSKANLMRKEYDMEGWVHMPRDSVEFRLYSSIVRIMKLPVTSIWELWLK